MRMGKGTPPAKYVETFFKGEGELLYFIKPFKWKGQDTKGKLEMDMTYHYKPDSVADFVVNFSFGTEEPVKKIESAGFNLSKEAFEGRSMDKIYVEPGKKGYKNRHTFEIGFEEMRSVFDAEAPEFTIGYKGKKRKFAPKGNWKKLRQRIKTYVFGVIDLEREEEE